MSTLDSSGGQAQDSATLLPTQQVTWRGDRPKPVSEPV